MRRGLERKGWHSRSGHGRAGHSRSGHGGTRCCGTQRGWAGPSLFRQAFKEGASFLGGPSRITAVFMEGREGSSGCRAQKGQLASTGMGFSRRPCSKRAVGEHGMGFQQTTVIKKGCFQARAGVFDLHPKSWTQIKGK